MVIWKYELPWAFNQMISVSMPKYSKLLSAQEQNGKLVVWAVILDPGKPLESRRFFIAPTGETLPDECPFMNFFATVQVGALVFHVFDYRVDL